MQTHEELHAETLTAARKEKSATLELLGFLERIEARRTFAVLGYPSLFKYVEEALGYSPAQASERISAMKLLKKVPEVAEKLTDGAHTLTSIAKLAAHVRRENLDSAQASALVQETENQTILSLEKHLAGIAEVELPRVERAKVISKELTRLTLDVDETFMKSLERVRELKGNPTLQLSEIFQGVMEEFIKKREVKPSATSVPEVGPKNGSKKKGKPESKRPETNKPEAKRSTVSAEEGYREPQPSSNTEENLKTGENLEEEKRNPNRSRYIPKKDRNVVRLRAGDQCEYRHEASGKRCHSKTGLQFEHVVPFAKGGSNDELNLKLFCPAHNRLSAIDEYGVEKMRPYLKR